MTVSVPSVLSWLVSHEYPLLRPVPATEVNVPVMVYPLSCLWLASVMMRDHEVEIDHSEALIYLSMTKRMLAKIVACFFRQPLRARSFSVLLRQSKTQKLADIFR